MSRAILISDPDTKVLVRLLTSVGIAATPLSEGDFASSARNLTDGDFVVIRQHSDGTGATYAATVADSTDAAVIFLARTLPASTAATLALHGVFAVDERAFCAAPVVLLAQVRAIHRSCLSLRKENARLKNKVNETKAVSRAKCLLMEKRNMTEQSAHRFIEKTAMDNRLSRRAVADNIIRNYEKHDSPDDISA